MRFDDLLTELRRIDFVSAGFDLSLEGGDPFAAALFLFSHRFMVRLAGESGRLLQ